MTPNIIIIVLDAVRAHNIPLYGYSRNTMPFLKSMSGELAVYNNAVSSSYWTMPSIASLFTGMYSSSHGLLADGDKLKESLVTLSDYLSKNGYRCGGFVNNLYVSEYSGLDKGFSDFFPQTNFDGFKNLLTRLFEKQMKKMLPPGVTKTKSDEYNQSTSLLHESVARLFDSIIDRGSKHYLKRFHKWIEANKQHPFFAYFHIFETHSPYRAPGKYAFNFLSLGEHFKKLRINHDHIKYLLNPEIMNKNDFAILNSAYDNSIVYADSIIQKIFSILKTNGMYDDSMIIILSDHGDNIGEHGLMFHYFCLYDTLIHIPLLIKYPSAIQRTGKIESVVQNVDIFPTICSLLNDNTGRIWNQFEGNDLLNRHPPKRNPDIAISELIKAYGPDRINYREKLKKFDRRILSVRTDSSKFIFSSNNNHEFYNLKEDPNELHNLYQDGGQYQELKAIASNYYKKMNAFYIAHKNKIEDLPEFGNFDDDIKRNLKSLGYL